MFANLVTLGLIAGALASPIDVAVDLEKRACPGVHVFVRSLSFPVTNLPALRNNLSLRSENTRLTMSRARARPLRPPGTAQPVPW